MEMKVVKGDQPCNLIVVGLPTFTSHPTAIPARTGSVPLLADTYFLFHFLKYESITKDHVGEALGKNNLGIVISLQTSLLRMAMHFPSKSFPPDQLVYNKNSLVWLNLHILNGLSLSSWHIISQFHCTSPSAHSFPQKISSSRYVSPWHLFLMSRIWSLSHLGKQKQTKILNCIPLTLRFQP